MRSAAVVPLGGPPAALAAALTVGVPSGSAPGMGNVDGGPGGCQDGMRHGTTKTRRLDRLDGRYVDDVRAWQADEPALDMTGAAVIAAAADPALRPGADIS